MPVTKLRLAIVGKHYVPRAYLRHFEIADHPGFVWIYDKQDGKPHVAPIAIVAQSRDYFSAEIENQLTEFVENPANGVIEKLLRHEPLFVSERFDLAYYMCTMMKRVPRHRRKSWEKYPAVLEQTITEVTHEVREVAQRSDSLDNAWLERQLADLAAAKCKLLLEPPQDVIDQVKRPWPSEDMVSLVYQMTWRILQSSGPQYFISSDNPVVLLGDLGLARDACEISFPLSTTTALHGCWRGQPQSLILMTPQQGLVREINRRVASGTERLAFCHAEEPWLQTTLAKQRPYLSRIIWR
jgi:hypothetical protein